MTHRVWRYGVGLLAAGALVWYVGPAALWSTLRHAQPLWLTLYLSALLVVPALYGTQLFGMLRLAGHRLPATYVVSASMQAWSIGTLTPARAGDLSLAYFLRDRVPEADTFAAVSIDKLVSLSTLALLALASAAVIAVPQGSALVTGAVIAFSATGTALFVARTQRASLLVRAISRRWPQARAEEAWGQAAKLANSPAVLLWCFATTLLRWLYICGANVLIFRAVAAYPDFYHVVAATAVGRIISLVPVSIGGVGLKEPAQIVIYGGANVPAEAVLAVSALGLACSLLVAAAAPFLARVLVISTRKEL